MIQVVPVAEGGVADYALNLRERWETLGVTSAIVRLSAGLAHERSLAGRVADAVGDHSQQSTVAVVLHFSGYGFSRRGACFWLLEELDRLRESCAGRLRLTVVFHELFATGPPWRSAFWLSSTQASIAARLARMADVLWTNTNRHASWIRTVARPSVTLIVRPVFSNIGEGPALAVSLPRSPVAVVFGLAPTRQGALDSLRGRERALKGLGVTELIEVGDGSRSRTSFGLEHRFLGRLDARALQALLHSSRFGIINYASHALAKSGVFAAYAASGCIVINTNAEGADADGLSRGHDYLDLARLANSGRSPGDVHGIATRLTRWYSQHALQTQAREMLSVALGRVL